MPIERSLRLGTKAIKREIFSAPEPPRRLVHQRIRASENPSVPNGVRGQIASHFQWANLHHGLVVFYPHTIDVEVMDGTRVAVHGRYLHGPKKDYPVSKVLSRFEINYHEINRRWFGLFKIVYEYKPA